MRAQFPTPDGVVGLVPMRIRYAYEHDGDDVIGIVLDTALGGFAVWLELPTAVQLAAQLVEIAEHADTLRQRYNTEQNRPPSPDAPPAMASLKP